MVNNCEQPHCNKSETEQQFFCSKCDMEVCGICVYEHRANTSISNLKCDDEILRGGRAFNDIPIQFRRSF